jgi:hypothetical protein
VNLSKSIVSLLAVALFSVAGSAYADQPARGIVAMPSVRNQIKVNAQAAGRMQPGTTLRLKYNASKTQVTASLWNKSNFNGGPVPLAKPVRMESATATFNVRQTSEGKLATPVKQGGQVWQGIMRALAPQAK